MAEHFCEYIVGFRMEPGEDGDPIFCDRPANIKYDRGWFCAEHYDTIMNRSQPKNWLLKSGKLLPFTTPNV